MYGHNKIVSRYNTIGNRDYPYKNHFDTHNIIYTQYNCQSLKNNRDSNSKD